MLVIPAIDVIGGSCVRLLKGDYGAETRYEVTPEEQAGKYQEAGFERVLDLLEEAGNGLLQHLQSRLPS